jgi:uncharacterized protein
VITYCAGAVQVAFRGMDPSEPLALARLACRTCRDGYVRDVLAYIDRLLEMAQENAVANPDVPYALMPATMAAMTLAGTAAVGAPAAAL